MALLARDGQESTKRIEVAPPLQFGTQFLDELVTLLVHDHGHERVVVKAQLGVPLDHLNNVVHVLATKKTCLALQKLVIIGR